MRLSLFDLFTHTSFDFLTDEMMGKCFMLRFKSIWHGNFIVNRLHLAFAPTGCALLLRDCALRSVIACFHYAPSLFDFMHTWLNNIKHNWQFSICLQGWMIIIPKIHSTKYCSKYQVCMVRIAKINEYKIFFIRIHLQFYYIFG